MTNGIALLTLATFSLTSALSQQPKKVLEVDDTIKSIESVIKSGGNVGEFIKPLFSDDGGKIFLNHRYTIDTTKRILHRVVQEYVNFEQVIFYYSKQNIIKVIISDTSVIGRSYKCEYYFDNDSIFLVREEGSPSPKNEWDSKTVTSEAKSYLINFSGICNMLDKRK